MHPMVICTAIKLHAASPVAYEMPQQNGILTLPGRTTLKDYTNYLAPEEGLQPEVTILICYILFIIFTIGTS